MENDKFDGLFMSGLQNCQGIDNFFDAMFSFMRRKTDFFVAEDRSAKTVVDSMNKHMQLFREEKKKQEVLQKKKMEEKYKKEAPPKTSGATVEEISEDEAMKIELENLRKRQAAAKEDLDKEEKKEDLGDEDPEGAYDKKRELEKATK